MTNTTHIDLAPIAPALSDALVRLQRRVDTARIALDETTAAYYAVANDGTGAAENAKAARHQAWARLTEAQECLATVERCR